jgi:two-component system chemotaxis response regulator CheY
MTYKILIVDDSPFIYKAIASLLPGSYEVCGHAKNGKEGAQLYFDLAPDLVTMDITMPIMDGLSASREILSKDSQARIVMLSAMGDDQLIKEAKALGIKVFLRKPFKAEALAAALAKALSAGKER